MYHEKMIQFNETIKQEFPSTKTILDARKDVPSLMSTWFFIVYNERADAFDVSFNVDSSPTKVAIFMKVILEKGYNIRIYNEHYVRVNKEGEARLYWGEKAQELFVSTMEKIFKQKFDSELQNQILLLQNQYGGKQ